MEDKPNSKNSFSMDHLKDFFKWNKPLSENIPINQHLDNVKNAYQPNTSIDFLHNTLDAEADKAVRNFVRSELAYIIRDALMPYEVHDNYFSGQAVYPFLLKEYFQHAISLQEIVLDYMLKDTSTYSRVVLDELYDGKPISAVLPLEPKVDERLTMYVELDVERVQKRFRVLHACVVEGAGGSAVRQSLYTLFALLNSVYSAFKNVSDLNKKFFIEIEGMSALLEKMSIDPEAKNSIVLNFVDQARSILEDDIVIVDKHVSLKVAPADFTDATTIISFIYKELSRILKVPESKLIGIARSGLNATGEYDDKNYQDTLNAIRKNVVEPLLHNLGYTYTFNYSIDSADFLQRMNAKLLMDERDITITLKGKKELSLKLFPWLQAEHIDYGEEREELDVDDESEE